MAPSPLPARSTLLGLLEGLRGRVRFEDEAPLAQGVFVFDGSVQPDAVFALANRGGAARFRGLLATPRSEGEATRVEATLSLHKVARRDGRLSVEVRLEDWRPLPEWEWGSGRGDAGR